MLARGPVLAAIVLSIGICGCGANFATNGSSAPKPSVSVATPIFTPAGGGSFVSPVTVSLTESTPGATIYYTTNGTTPTATSSVYTQPLTVAQTATINAVAIIAASNSSSGMASATYTYAPAAVQAATPVVSPASGTSFATTLSVSIADTTPGATVYYTTDGSTPTTASSVYSTPFAISASTTIKALAVASGDSPSAVATATYSYAPVAQPAATPVLMPASGTSFSTTLSVSIAETTQGATVYYTTDGSTPTSSSRVYSAPFTISTSTTVKAIATAAGDAQSAIATATYVYAQVVTPSPAAAPTFAPADGTSFATPLNVSIADTTPSATIFYTTDGSTPTTSSTVYSSPFTINATTTVKAIATASGFTPGPASAATYTYAPVAPPPPAAPPMFAPTSGTSFSSTLQVSIADSTPGATIYYTTNGSAPTNSSSVYSAPFTINATTTVTAIAVANGYTQSAVNAATYTYTPVAASPVLSPAGGTSFSSTLQVSIADTTPGATIYYTTNGSAPSTASSVYSAPFTINATTTVTAIAVANGYTQSAVTAASYTYTPVTASPVLSPSGGTSFSSTLQVSIADSTPGATIYYTTNGSAPSTASSVYSAPFTINATTTVNAIAVAKGYTQSAVTAATYTYAPVAATPVLSPANGNSFSSTLQVSIADTTPGATIYYTTNGSAPSTASSVYSSPFTITATTTVNAIATANGYTQSATGTASYTYAPANAGIVSDNFDETALNTSLWTLENPLGDGIVTMNGTAATLNVPMGKTHDLTTAADNAVRIMQPMSNSDFSVDARFQSAVEIGDQDEGILVEQDSGAYVRFDVLFGNNGPTLFAEGISGGNATTFVDTQITLAKAPLFLRLARTGNVWTGSWSTDGNTFTAAPSFTFDLNAAKIGPYAATYAPTAFNSPAFTAIVDYFFATSQPVSNQDGPLPYGYATVDANPPGTLVEKTLADIQGTGQLEPVIGIEQYTANGDTSNGGIYWYSYPTSGGVQGSWVRHAIIAGGNAYEDILPLDVNGDGAVDLVASYNNSSGVYQIVWFENPRGSGGDPTQPWNQHAIGPGYGENNMQLGDLDGDGKIDIITPSSVFFQNSPNSWTEVKYSPSFRGVARLDIGSGHGAINLSGTGPSPSFNAVWYENPRETGGNARTGTWAMHFIGPTPYPCGSNNCQDGGDVAAYGALDVNGDGKMDLISSQSEGPAVVAPPPGGLIWWEAPADRRNGTWIKHTIDGNVIDVHQVVVADMNQDGHEDIIVAEQDQSPLRRVLVYYNDGQGNLTPEIISNAEGHNIRVGSVTGKPSEIDILNSGHGYYLNSHPLQIFLNPY